MDPVTDFFLWAEWQPAEGNRHEAAPKSEAVSDVIFRHRTFPRQIQVPDGRSDRVYLGLAPQTEHSRRPLTHTPHVLRAIHIVEFRSQDFNLMENTRWL